LETLKIELPAHKKKKKKKKIQAKRVRFIIDCTEIEIERPKSPKFAHDTWSEYKQRYTVKFLVALTPDGRIAFVSDAYGGRCTDEFITEDCGFLELLEPGDIVLSDKGFTGSHLFLSRGALLIRPLNMREGGYDAGEVEFNRRLASCRIHVERAMRRIKAFGWLHGPIKISQLKNISLAFKVLFLAVVGFFEFPIIIFNYFYFIMLTYTSYKNKGGLSYRKL
jgi:hypothetical protein